MNIEAIARLAPVLPVLTIERLADAVPLARALVKGGLPVVEVTLRTAVALDALRAIAAEVPGVVAGAGTVLEPTQLDQVQRAGARFVVSPGCTPALAAAIQAAGLPFLPGIQTVSEAMVLAEAGYRLLKFFPASSAGGVNWLKAVAAPLADIRFCPTGGIDSDSAPSYLALPNVACVGGSWVAPGRIISTGDWHEVERLAAAASRLNRFWS
ncbi:MAG: bifunctional 4-hydroxy-2-oxoglutarate aldolase/2-dehydro-3-deoxy-phosphogluconate aldolase [Reyranella sp.]|uniref:bifunctional 4-hydroxy-2-oxoglutarate aldolase/2-dehydro-3-deoxy-phosphogluconate aldolase n=1 Tax=Reyranella sp. TaxID=1929291 RepID=UPI003D0BB1A2